MSNNMTFNSSSLIENTSTEDPQISLTGWTVEESADDLSTQITGSESLIKLDGFRADSRFEGIDGTGYTVVVLDTGIDLDHHYFGDDADGDGVSDRIVYSYDFADNDADASDYDDHGSNVSSIIGGYSEQDNYSGVAPGVEIIHLKVFTDSGQGSLSYVEEALQWVEDNVEAYNIVSVNMSLATDQNWSVSFDYYSPSDELQRLADDYNVVSVAAAGNGYNKSNHPAYQTEGVAYPAASKYTIGVGAVDDNNDQITSFSQRHINEGATTQETLDNTLTEIFAPGMNILGANRNGGTVSMNGTSQAAPHIAGVVALAQQLANQELGRRLTFTEIETLLYETGDTIHDTNTNKDYKRVNMVKLGEAILAMAEPVPDNNAPVANNDSYSLDEDKTLTITASGLLINDSDIDNGDVLTVDSFTQPNNGSVNVNSDGSFTYTPTLNYNGSDSFTYTVSDGNGGSDTAIVSLTINAVNDAPVANNDSYETNEDETLTITAPGLLANDSDIDGDVLTVDSFTQPNNGSVTINSDGSFTYNPNTGFVGTDSFTYTVSDGKETSNITTVALTVHDLPDTQTSDFAITVNDVPVDYQESDVECYAGSQDRTGTVTFPEANTINLTGNNWKAVALTPYTITSNTVLTFEFQSLQQGEMQGIGLDSDLNLNSGGNNIINLYGTETFSTITDFRYSNTVGGWQSFSVNLGNYSVYQDQTVTHLFFVNDDDGHSAGDSWFRNIQLSEQDSPSQPPSADNFAITVNDVPVDYQESDVECYAESQDRTGTVTFPEANTINLTGNNWKAVALTDGYTITSNTVLTFEFQSLQQGEMQGIGLDTDLNLNSGGDNIINLYGTETFSTITDFRYDGEVGGWQSFSINLGNYSVYQDQTVTHLFFVNDDDGHSAGDSWFRNIQLSETTNNASVNISQVTEDEITGNNNPAINNDLVDDLLGTNYADGFILGTETEIYYDDYSAADYALIQDFDLTQDTIQLQGSATDYQMRQVSDLGMGIFYGANDELIGVLQGNSNIMMNDLAFIYV